MHEDIAHVVPNKPTCTVPPANWVCSRPHGHEGSCAAWPEDIYYRQVILQEFLAWAKRNLGQGYSLEMEEGTFVDRVTRWCFIGYKAGKFS